jgi:pantoate--beta-alanine ligase
MMEVIHAPHEASRFTWALREGNRTVGIVPTMGAIHEGHLSLVRLSRQTCDATVATIFVNPTQFGPSEDLDEYPRTIRRDCELLQREDVAAVFVPNNESMYPRGFSTYVEPPDVGKSLEGVCRPGHFRGVTTIVMKLFQSMPATHAFFGKKDYQQLKVIEAMTRDLDIGIQIIAGETVRESDGLALSSRNRYLSAEQRPQAVLLSRSLEAVNGAIAAGERKIEVLESVMRQMLMGTSDAPSANSHRVDKIDYAVVVDAATMSQIAQLDRPAVALIAAYVGDTRLIDNREVSPE